MQISINYLEVFIKIKREIFRSKDVGKLKILIVLLSYQNLDYASSKFDFTIESSQTYLIIFNAGCGEIFITVVRQRLYSDRFRSGRDQKMDSSTFS
jgi:hypothetical protein